VSDSLFEVASVRFSHGVVRAGGLPNARLGFGAHQCAVGDAQRHEHPLRSVRRHQFRLTPGAAIDADALAANDQLLQLVNRGLEVRPAAEDADLAVAISCCARGSRRILAARPEQNAVQLGLLALQESRPTPVGMLASFSGCRRSRRCTHRRCPAATVSATEFRAG
jgi:hypothetical protein